MRLPEFSADWTVVIFPNVAGAETSTEGGAKFGWFIKFVNVASNRRRSFSLNWNVFDMPLAIVVVPGPTKLPTAQFPIRPAPGTGLNAAILKY